MPHLPKIDPSCQKEWSKFSTMLSSDKLNFGEMQLYVDTLPGTPGVSVQPTQDKFRNKSPFFVKARKESPASNDSNGLNPSKTFGG